MNELSLHILDIVQNSIRAGARLINIFISELPAKDSYRMEISDDGSGMDEKELAKVCDPFYTSQTTRKVGLGIPLMKQTAEQTGGSFNIQSEKGKGTKIKTKLGYKHIDRPIMGDIAGTLLILTNNETQAQIIYHHRTPKGEYIFDTREIIKTLDGVPISNPEIRRFLKEMINQNLEQIQISE